MIETDRLLLRPHGYDDLDALARVYADPDVRRFLGGDLLTRDRAAYSLGRYVTMQEIRGHSPWAAVERATGDYVGRIGLLWWPQWDEVEVGWTLGRWAWGHGYATEGGAASLDWAFAHLDVPRVICCIAPANAGSLAVKDRLGLEFDRHDELFGTPVDVYAVTRAAWLRRRRPPVTAPAGSGPARTA